MIISRFKKFVNVHSTWGTAEGKWFYDCEPDDVKISTNSSGNHLETIEQVLTNAERLEKDLLSEYDALIAPLNLTTVLLNFDLTQANFNAKKVFMSSQGRFRAVHFESTQNSVPAITSFVNIFAEMD